MSNFRGFPIKVNYFEADNFIFQVKDKKKKNSLARSASDDFTDRIEWDETKSKGTFYFEGDIIISHQYILKVAKKTKLDISIQVNFVITLPV